MKRLLLLSLFLAGGSASASVDPQIAEKCKDARDFLGCVNAFSSPPKTSNKSKRFFRVGTTKKHWDWLYKANESMKIPSDFCSPISCIVSEIERDRFGVQKPLHWMEYEHETGSTYLFPVPEIGISSEDPTDLKRFQIYTTIGRGLSMKFDGTPDRIIGGNTAETNCTTSGNSLITQQGQALISGTSSGFINGRMVSGTSSANMSGLNYNINTFGNTNCTTKRDQPIIVKGLPAEPGGQYESEYRYAIVDCKNYTVILHPQLQYNQKPAPFYSKKDKMYLMAHGNWYLAGCTSKKWWSHAP